MNKTRPGLTRGQINAMFNTAWRDHDICFSFQNESGSWCGYISHIRDGLAQSATVVEGEFASESQAMGAALRQVGKPFEEHPDRKVTKDDLRRWL